MGDRKRGHYPAGGRALARSPYKWVSNLTAEERQQLQVLARRGKTEQGIADPTRMISRAE